MKLQIEEEKTEEQQELDFQVWKCMLCQKELDSETRQICEEYDCNFNQPEIDEVELNLLLNEIYY